MFYILLYILINFFFLLLFLSSISKSQRNGLKYSPFLWCVCFFFPAPIERKRTFAFLRNVMIVSLALACYVSNQTTIKTRNFRMHEMYVNERSRFISFGIVKSCIRTNFPCFKLHWLARKRSGGVSLNVFNCSFHQSYRFSSC